MALLKLYNNRLPIKATPEQLVEMYYNEAGKEGIRWDLAFCQALWETGFFHFGGTVVPAQIFCVFGNLCPGVGAPILLPRTWGCGPTSSI